MDHYYYLNRSYQNSTEIALFNGILKKNLEAVSFTTGNGNIALTDRQITEELKNWKTRTGESDFSNLVSIQRRGNPFDLNSEFHFLVVELLKKKEAIPQENFHQELNFRVYSTEGKKKYRAS